MFAHVLQNGGLQSVDLGVVTDRRFTGFTDHALRFLNLNLQAATGFLVNGILIQALALGVEV